MISTTAPREKTTLPIRSMVPFEPRIGVWTKRVPGVGHQGSARQGNTMDGTPARPARPANQRDRDPAKEDQVGRDDRPAPRT